MKKRNFNNLSLSIAVNLSFNKTESNDKVWILLNHSDIDTSKASRAYSAQLVTFHSASITSSSVIGWAAMVIVPKYRIMFYFKRA